MSNQGNHCNIISFLKDQFIPIKNIRAIIFGSFCNELEYDDCDLLLITNLNSTNGNWKILRNETERIKSLFYEAFKVELSYMVYTRKEYNENTEFLKRISRKKTIEISNSL